MCTTLSSCRGGWPHPAWSRMCAVLGLTNGASVQRVSQARDDGQVGKLQVGMHELRRGAQRAQHALHAGPVGSHGRLEQERQARRQRLGPAPPRAPNRGRPPSLPSRSAAARSSGAEGNTATPGPSSASARSRVAGAGRRHGRHPRPTVQPQRRDIGAARPRAESDESDADLAHDSTPPVAPCEARVLEDGELPGSDARAIRLGGPTESASRLALPRKPHRSPRHLRRSPGAPPE